MGFPELSQGVGRAGGRGLHFRALIWRGMGGAVITADTGASSAVLLLQEDREAAAPLLGVQARGPLGSR